MIALFCLFLTLSVSPFKSKSRLEAENAALRHQLIVLQAGCEVASSSQMGIACSWSCCIDCFHRCSGPSLSSDRRPWCVGIGPAFAYARGSNFPDRQASYRCPDEPPLSPSRLAPLLATSA